MAIKSPKEHVPQCLTKIKVNSFFLLPEEFTVGSGMDISSILHQQFHHLQAPLLDGNVQGSLAWGHSKPRHCVPLPGDRMGGTSDGCSAQPQGWLAAEGSQQTPKPPEIQPQGREFPLPGTETPSSPRGLREPNSRAHLTTTDHFSFTFLSALYTSPST